MSETLVHIDNYFGGTLTTAERLAFEKRCEEDEAFAEEVAFYIASRDAIKKEAHLERKKEFEELYRQHTPASRPEGIVRKLVPYISAAAACLLVFFAWMLFMKPADPRKLASAYIDNNLSTLSITMSAAKDSVQIGIANYNDKHYAEAEKIFKSLKADNEVAPDAIKYLGILYLQTGRYDEAIAQFDTLAKYGTLFANPALFYKAVVLMKRSASGDREAAKDLLEEVVKKDLSGSKEAREWLNKL